MYNQFVFLYILGKVAALGVFEIQLSAHILCQPSRDFYSADIFADRMMGTSLRHQDFVAGF